MVVAFIRAACSKDKKGGGAGNKIINISDYYLKTEVKTKRFMQSLMYFLWQVIKSLILTKLIIFYWINIGHFAYVCSDSFMALIMIVYMIINWFKQIYCMCVMI